MTPPLTAVVSFFSEFLPYMTTSLALLGVSLLAALALLGGVFLVLRRAAKERRRRERDEELAFEAKVMSALRRDERPAQDAPDVETPLPSRGVPASPADAAVGDPVAEAAARFLAGGIVARDEGEVRLGEVRAWRVTLTSGRTATILPPDADAQALRWAQMESDYAVLTFDDGRPAQAARELSAFLADQMFGL